jgi:hypothetical protein
MLQIECQQISKVDDSVGFFAFVSNHTQTGEITTDVLSSQFAISILVRL